MLVPVVAVGSVAVIVMHMVDMVAVLHGLVAATRLMLVLMRLVHNVDHVVALVVVPIVRPVDMAVVKVVDVVSVPKRGMPAVWAVLMGVVGMGPMHLHTLDLNSGRPYPNGEDGRLFGIRKAMFKTVWQRMQSRAIAARSTHCWSCI